MDNNKTARLGNDSIGKLLFKLALPAITAQLVNLLYNMVDRMYIGRIEGIGADALTGVGVSFPIVMIISAFAALIGYGGAPRASIEMGRGNHEKAQQILGNCVTTLLIMSSVLTAFFLIFGQQLLMMFGANHETIVYANDYLQIYTCGTVFVQIALGLNMFITSQGFSGTGMLTVLIGAVINIILDPILIFGLHMDVRGAALATIISQGVSALWVIRFLAGPRTTLKIRRKYLKPSLKIVLPVLALGVSPFIMQATESVITICFNTSLLRYGGKTAVGSMTILSSIMQFALLPLMGLTQGAQPIISYNYGANNPGRVKKAFRLLLIACLTFSIALWASIQLFPQAFAAIFTNDAGLIEYTTWSLRIYTAALFIFGAQIACQQTFLALGNAKASLFLAVLRKIILLIPFIFLLPLILPDAETAVFLAEPVADTIAVITTVVTFIFQFRKTIGQMEHSVPAQKSVQQ